MYPVALRIGRRVSVKHLARDEYGPSDSPLLREGITLSFKFVVRVRVPNRAISLGPRSLGKKYGIDHVDHTVEPLAVLAAFSCMTSGSDGRFNDIENDFRRRQRDSQEKKKQHNTARTEVAPASVASRFCQHMPTFR